MADTEGLRRLRPQWNALEAEAGVQPFLSWDWQMTWWEVFGENLELRCLLVRDQGQVIGLVPLYTDPRQPAIMRLGGGVELSDHLGFPAVPGQVDAVARAALGWLFGQGGTKPAELDLHYLVEGSSELAALERAAAELGLGWELEHQQVSPRVELAPDFETFLVGRLGKKDRHELRRKRRRLDQERPGWCLRTQEELGLEAGLDAFLELLRASGPHKAEFLTPKVEDFIRRLSARFQERGWLRLQVLQAAGEGMAASHGFSTGDTWYLYNSGYRADLAPLSPGLICVAEGIRVAGEQGYRWADFLRGDEGYKYHLGAQDRSLWRARIRPGAGL